MAINGQLIQRTISRLLARLLITICRFNFASKSDIGMTCEVMILIIDTERKRDVHRMR